jgi:hypothetical protein
VVLKCCSGRRRPPKKKHIPRMRRRLERILPIREVWTMTTSLWARAMIATMSSTALLHHVSITVTQSEGGT